MLVSGRIKGGLDTSRARGLDYARLCNPGGLRLSSMSQQVSIRLPDPMIAELDRRAKRRRRARADVIRDALSAYLELPEGALQRRPIDRIRHLLGAIDGLPSRADDYLEDLGRSR